MKNVNDLQMEQRIVWVDWAKFICMYLVIVGHIASGVGEKSLYIKDIFTYFHMPMFFFISGYLFKCKNNVVFLDFLKSRIKTLLLPYITLNILVLLCVIPYYMFCGGNVVSRIIYVVWQILVVSSKHDGGATWFLICLFFTEFIAYFLLKCKISIVLLFTMFSALISTISYIPSEFYLKIDVVFMAVPFFIVGFYCKKYAFFDKIKRNYLLEFLLLIICLLIPLFNGRPNMYFRYMGNYPFLYYPIVFLYIFIFQRLLLSFKSLPKMVKNISNGTILYIGLQGVGILYWNMLLSTIGIFSLIPPQGYLNSIIGGCVVMFCVYPIMLYVLSIFPQWFGRKKLVMKD